MRTLVNSIKPDEMPHNVAFYQGLHCLLRQKLSSKKEIQFRLEVIACDALICTIEYSKFIVSN